MIWWVITFLLAIFVRLAMPFLIETLRRKAVLDMPNARSSHSIPTPRGGGWLVMGVPILALFVSVLVMPLADPLKISLTSLAVSLGLLTIISALDDKYTLSALTRLAVQFLAVAIVVFTLPDSVRVFPLFSPLVEKLVLLLGVIWMVNLTNFIDGINGITIVNGLAVAAGLALANVILVTHPSTIILPLSAALIAGGLIGFAPWNLPNARIFLGDVGSVPLGLWQAYGLCFVASAFGLIPAILMCMYPLMDASTTLIKRALQRKRILEAHREHFYQQAVQNNRSHARTSTLILGFNLLTLGLAAVSMLYPLLEYFCLAIGLSVFIALVCKFRRAPEQEIVT